MKKTTADRMLELQKALRALQLANAHFQESHDDAYLLLTQAQLRALLIRGRSIKPLLFELSASTEIPIDFYGLPAIAGANPRLAASIVTGMTWSPRPVKGMERTNLSTFLGGPFYFVQSTSDYRSRTQVLKHISNKEGGAHYDEEVAAIVDTLRRARAGFKNADDTEYSINGIHSFLLDLSALVYWAGMRLGFTWNDGQKGIDEKSDARILRLDDQFARITAQSPFCVVEFLTA